jgi:small nuclear ribonucleoprotein (snRNP)-like protein
VARNANLVLANAREVVVADASANLVLVNAREVVVADASANLVLVNAVNYKKY